MKLAPKNLSLIVTAMALSASAYVATGGNGQGTAPPANPSPTPVEAPVIAFPNLTLNESGVFLTEKLTVDVTPTLDSTLQLFVDGRRQTGNTARLVMGLNTVYMTKKVEERIVSSNSLRVLVDQEGPRVDSVRVVASPTLGGVGTAVVVRFADDDFNVAAPPTAVDALDPPADDDNTSAPNIESHFEVYRQAADGRFSEQITITSATVSGRSVQLHFDGRLAAGQYRLVVKATLEDRVGNGLFGSPTWSFNVPAERTFGQHVEFPPFAPPTEIEPPEKGFNPADFVETRVARLYYFRDAARVAQILNRNIRSYNEAAVTHAQQRAEESRDAAADATDQRRKYEREAVRAAEKARNAESRLAAARQGDEVRQRLEDEREILRAQLAEVETLIAKVDGAQQVFDDAQKRRSEAHIQMIAARREVDLGTLDVSQARLVAENALHEQEAAHKVWKDTSDPDEKKKALEALEEKRAAYHKAETQYNALERELLRRQNNLKHAEGGVVACGGALRAGCHRSRYTGGEQDPA